IAGEKVQNPIIIRDLLPEPFGDSNNGLSTSSREDITTKIGQVSRTVIACEAAITEKFNLDL
ncbi:1643_t:CDS:2, partial [Gigaspora margarita]